jgi:hypothetical protein
MTHQFDVVSPTVLDERCDGVTASFVSSSRDRFPARCRHDPRPNLTGCGSECLYALIRNAGSYPSCARSS